MGEQTQFAVHRPQYLKKCGLPELDEEGYIYIVLPCNE